MKRTLVGLLCVGLIGVATPALAQKKPGSKNPPTQTPQTKAADTAKLATDDFIKANYENALKLFLEAVNLDPDTPDYLFNAGLCHMKIGDKNAGLKNNPTAIEEYQAAIDIFQALLVKIPASNTALKERVGKSLVDSNQKLAEIKFGNDKDRDLVTDSEDLCPADPGTVSAKGCPDKDGDSVADKDDMCVSDIGPTATKGCPDKDGDLVADKDDACPDVTGIEAEKGCAAKAKGPDKPDDKTSEGKKVHKILFAASGGFGVGAISVGALGLSRIVSGKADLNDGVAGAGGKISSGVALGPVADVLGGVAIACGVAGFVLRPKKGEKTAVLVTPTSVGLSTTF